MQRSEKGGTLIIVPCGKKKVWDKQPTAGPTPAKDAYRGGPFTLNKKYAEKFGDTWLILSAKYGFIEPTFVIPENYNVTFKGTATGSISVVALRRQLYEQRLDKFSTVVGLGGKDYRSVIEEAFQGTSVTLRFPFSGLGIMKSNRAISQAIKSNDPSGLEKETKVHPDVKSTLQPRIAVPHTSNRPQNVSDMCQTLHGWFNGLPVFRFPFPSNALPANGIYVLFEEGEQAHGTNRIVRIGTHTGNGKLHSRLNEHFVKENKDRSIFRKNIGRCLLRRTNDPFLDHWNIDLTSRVAKDAYGDQIDPEKQRQVEQRNNSRCYYRSRRLGKRVLRDYLGSGPEAELSAKLDALRREQRRDSRELWLKLVSALQAADRLLADFNCINHLLAAALLLLAGWHSHNHVWRPRRVYRKRSIDD